MAKHNHDGYKTAKEVGAMLDLSADYIRCLIRKGKIKAEKFGGVWLIDLHSFKKIKRVRFPRTGEIKNGEVSA
jgi:excisionase family DNA binding protein